MVVRLVMEGDLGKEAASMVNVCRQTVSHSVSLFNEGGLDLSSGFRPRTRAVSH
ncbi:MULTISPECIES: helix-turn-helix domain-containing protein [Geobacillus]|nr:helix-turn-helix domain-containing protein [Geobacillus thermodenitrificans]